MLRWRKCWISRLHCSGFMKSEYAEFFANINETGAYNDDVVSTLREAIEKFKATQTY